MSALTAGESRRVTTVMHPLTPRILHVVRVEELSPLVRRVVLTGDSAGAIPYLPWSPGDHVKLSLPDAAGMVSLPRIEGGRAVWDEFRAETRDYTIRCVDPAAGELTIDGILHGHGPAGRWFAAAAPGDRIGVLGPRGSHVYPSDYGHYLLIADETALPALGRWLEQPLPGRVSVITVSERPDVYPLPTLVPPAMVEWRCRVAPLDANRGPLLAAEVSDALLASPTPDDIFVWAAGEAGAMRAVRRVLRESDLPRHAFDVDGYWRQGVANLDHHAVDDED